MKLHFAHVAHHPGLTISISESNYSDSLPFVSEIFVRGLSIKSDDSAAVLAALVLVHEYIGDTLELPFPIGVPFAEAIRIICPQTSSIGPVRGQNRSPSTGEVEVLSRRARANPQNAPQHAPGTLTVDWHGDFVMGSEDGVTSVNFAYGRLFTNAGLVANEPLVDIAMALFAVGSRLGRLNVPSLVGCKANSSLGRLRHALEVVGVTLVNS